MPDQQVISSTSQDFLEIFDITRNAVILKDGTVSVILMISAMNFGLLAEQEQDSIIYAYAALLNSLNFPIQIMIRSKTKDATSYLSRLDSQAKKASSSEKQNLIKRYQDFVGRLIKERNVLDKKFYVVIPALPVEVGMITVESAIPGKEAPQLTRDQKSAVLEKALGILEPRRDHLISQFNRIGLYARQIETQEIIEIFYSSYNPESSEGQQITDSRNYTTMMVNASTNLPNAPATTKAPETPVVDPSIPEVVAPPSAPQPVAPEVKQAPPESPTGYASEPALPVQQMPTEIPQPPESAPPVLNTPAPALETPLKPTPPSPLPPVAEL